MKRRNKGRGNLEIIGIMIWEAAGPAGFGVQRCQRSSRAAGKRAVWSKRKIVLFILKNK